MEAQAKSQLTQAVLNEAPDQESLDAPQESVAAPTAGARPLFQIPFACGARIRLSTYKGHGDFEIDMMVGSGTPVLASAAGTAYRGHSTRGGYQVSILHSNGWRTLYLHLRENSYQFSDGQRVEQGQHIANSGNTGTPPRGGEYVPHLHYEQQNQIGGRWRAVHAWFNGVPSNITDDARQNGYVETSHNCGDAALSAIYAIQSDGTLLWYRHEGRRDGSFAWTGPQPVGAGWENFKGVFPGGNGVIYAIQPDGALLWYRHVGRGDGSIAWGGPQPVGDGWQDFKHVFAGGEGSIYAIQPDGTLLWYRHEGRDTGTPAWRGPKAVGGGWQDFKCVFAGGDGIIYAIQPDGALLWYRHEGRGDGSFAWSGPKPVGAGWENFNSMFAGGNGIIYAIQSDGALLWYRHEGRGDGTVAWSGPKPVGTGWQNFKYVFGF